jgi:hypothetical protein
MTAIFQVLDRTVGPSHLQVVDVVGHNDIDLICNGPGLAAVQNPLVCGPLVGTEGHNSIIAPKSVKRRDNSGNSES